MGCGCCSHASADDEPLRVTVFGLENSGKTSLVQVLKDSKKLPVTSAYVSTHGVIAVHVQTRVHLLVFDCGGCKHQRHIWPHLMNDADVVLFAVDSTDLVCLGEAKDALCDLLEDEALTDKPLLMVFTKADRREHPPLRQLEEALDLARIQDRSVHKVLFSSVSHDGLTLLTAWLTYFSHQKIRGKDMTVTSSTRYPFSDALNLSTSSNSLLALTTAITSQSDEDTRPGY